MSKTPRRRSPWRRVRFLAASFFVIFITTVLTERALSAVFPFPRHLIERLPRSVCVYANDGSLLRVFPTRDEERVIPVPIDEVSPHLLDALIRSEDQRFFSHRGVDVFAVLRATLQNIRSGAVVSGASTITMQVVRILMPDAPRTMEFKLEQMFRARQLERLLTKREILEIYVDHVPLGGAVRGFEAAARHWFGIGAGALRPEQAATLVAMLPAPSYRSPRKRPDLLLRLRDRILARMRDAGDLAADDYVASAARPFDARRFPWPFEAPHACEYLLRRSRSREGNIQTTLDPVLQRRLQRLAATHTTRADAVAIVVVGRRSGALRGLVGSPGYDTVRLNTAACPRCVGSTLKPFLYALALEQGVVHRDGLLEDTPMHAGDYRPANFTRDYVGAIGLRDALATSRNLPAVRLLRAVGPERFAALLDRLGLLDALSKNPLAGGLARTVAVKTGTSSGRRDAWCVRITAMDVIVVWLGNLSGRGGPDLVGSGSATPLLARVVLLLGD